ncbi:MAG: PAC2 family protein [Chloroflexota bacterium]
MNEINLILYDKPYLRRPHMVLAFAGWPDAGEVATGALRYLISKTKASALGAIPYDPFYDFTTLRPITSIERGELKLLRLPTNDLYSLVSERSGHDFIFLLATEPHLHWETYARQVMRVVEEFGVSQLVTLGSMFDAVPHTKEAKVSGMGTTEAVRATLRESGVVLIDYQGPSSFHTLVHRFCQQRGIASASLWGHAPLYVRAPANPKVCWALLNRLASISSLDLDLTDLRTAGEYLTDTLDKLMAQNDAIRLYVRRLEEQYDEGAGGPTVADEGAEQMIRDVEEFLRREQRRGRDAAD